MSESPRKLRSPLAAYGPIIGPCVVIVVAGIVAFSMATTRPEQPAPTPVPTPISPERMRERLGVPDPRKLKERVAALVKQYGYSWYDLPESEQRNMMRETRGQGKVLFQEIVDEIRQAEFQQKKKP